MTSPLSFDAGTVTDVSPNPSPSENVFVRVGDSEIEFRDDESLSLLSKVTLPMDGETWDGVGLSEDGVVAVTRRSDASVLLMRYSDCFRDACTRAQGASSRIPLLKLNSATSGGSNRMCPFLRLDWESSNDPLDFLVAGSGICYWKYDSEKSGTDDVVVPHSSQIDVQAFPEFPLYSSPHILKSFSDSYVSVAYGPWSQVVAGGASGKVTFFDMQRQTTLKSLLNPTGSGSMWEVDSMESDSGGLSNIFCSCASNGNALLIDGNEFSVVSEFCHPKSSYLDHLKCIPEKLQVVMLDGFGKIFVVDLRNFSKILRSFTVHPNARTNSFGLDRIRDTFNFVSCDHQGELGTWTIEGKILAKCDRGGSWGLGHLGSHRRVRGNEDSDFVDDADDRISFMQATVEVGIRLAICGCEILVFSGLIVGF